MVESEVKNDEDDVDEIMVNTFHENQFKLLLRRSCVIYFHFVMILCHW